MRLQPNRSASDEPSDESAVADSYVLGGEHLGASVARRLQARGHSVALVDETHEPGDVPGLQGDPGDIRVLEAAGVPDASMVIVTTPNDGRNLLIAQLVRAHFDVPEVLVLVNVPDRTDLVADVGHEPVCATTLLSDTIVDSVERTTSELKRTA